MTVEVRVTLASPKSQFRRHYFSKVFLPQFRRLPKAIHCLLQSPEAIPFRIKFLWWPNEHFFIHQGMQESSAHITHGDAPVSCQCHAEKQSHCDQ